ncbi:MAG: class I SAM-dependent methyltransferase [Candidatus Omnitrophica bacterium]|nr:class I SAM-dependent methyltransferase [Candidatus Omnitrophota bacterium]MBU1869395.1 class I SAM-dependent methyltransferase [Candidatus Omnitrophota bacterium]
MDTFDNILGKLYQVRFNKDELAVRNHLWEIFCQDFFQQFIGKDDVVLDVGAGYGEFINHIKCRQKFAVELNEESRQFFDPDVKLFNSHACDLNFLKDGSVDAVFMSNFSEHLLDKKEVVKTLLEALRVLKPKGRIILMGPNIRYVYKEYWDFFDHFIPLSHKALAELLQAIGFKIERAIPKFLPFTTKSRIPKNDFAVRMYLRFPFIWKIMGRQMLIVASKI